MKKKKTYEEEMTYEEKMTPTLIERVAENQHYLEKRVGQLESELAEVRAQLYDLQRQIRML